MIRLVIATGNRGKVDEIADLLSNHDISLTSLRDFPCMPEIVEDGSSFLENALIKARTTASYTGLPALADDSGLEVDALDGRPGILSARFAPTAEERNNRVLTLLKNIPETDRKARFACALALVRPDGFEWTSTGTCEGNITYEARGEEGFGYDPIFFYPPFGRTFAEIPRDLKNTVSHRGKALGAFVKAVTGEGILDRTGS